MLRRVRVVAGSAASHIPAAGGHRSLGAIVRGAKAWIAGVAGAVAFVAVGVLAGYFIYADRNGGEAELPPDTPPPEYLYLDSVRVLAYLGQVAGGLSDTERRQLARLENREAKLAQAQIGEIGRSVQTEQRLEQVVRPTASDRFYRLLLHLRAGQSRAEGRQRPWLHDLDARLGDGNRAAVVHSVLSNLREGDFVRIRNARLRLPPYAAVFPLTAYAESYLGGGVTRPPRPLFAPLSLGERAAIARYIKSLGRNPILPFVARTRGGAPGEERATFFIPGQYRALLSAPRLLSGNVTVVGKVVYRDARSQYDPTCGRSRQRCFYFDRHTFATYGPALRRAPASVLRNLRLVRSKALRITEASMRLGVPVLVVVPVAIYE